MSETDQGGVAASIERWWDRAARTVGGRRGNWKIGLQTYACYGTADELRFACRVLRDPGLAKTSIHDTVWQNFKASFHRFESDEVPGAKLSIRIGRNVEKAISDEEGYANGAIQLLDPVSPGWHSLEIAIDRLPFGHKLKDIYRADCLVPSSRAEFGIISDVDDTILHTQVTSRLKMLLWSALRNSQTRLPLPGVARLYRNLAAVAGVENVNPVFYVSSSPWNLYPVIANFLRTVDLPVGPLLLRDMGIGGGASLKSDHSHKACKIANILETYPDLPFILLGDSGEKDAEIYGEISREKPGRILCSYIRETGHADPVMIQKAQEASRSVGSELLLMPDTDAISNHARSRGWL